ncbi:MAG: hypothetical protein FWB74_10005 [Defluviitaleaceae bacterium]|nr:hypothetical protein [Defluviitaleaceae bacterium]
MAGNSQSSVFSLSAVLAVGMVVLGVVTFISMGSENESSVFWLVLAVVLGGLIFLGAFLYQNNQRKKAREKFENAKLDRMLEKPFETLESQVDDEAARLARMYDGGDE